MKIIKLLFVSLLASSTAAAQTTLPKAIEPYTRKHRVTGQYVPLYGTWVDTTVVAMHANQGDVVRVVGLGRKWAQVKHNGAQYFLLKRHLNIPGAIEFGPDEVAFPRDPTSGQISYEAEVAVPGTQAELVGRAQVWLATAFRTKGVLQVQDAATGVLVGKAFSEIFVFAPDPVDHRLDFTIRLICKDGSYRYAISGFGFGAFLGSFGNVTGSPAERLVFETKFNGKQRNLVLKYKSELYRAAQEVQHQLRTAMNKPIGS
jgi:hypothetical protein